MAGIESTAGIRMGGELRGLDAYRIAAKPPQAAEDVPGFIDTLKEHVNNVNELQHTSDGMFRQFLRGEAELHDVALASQEAGIAMRLTSEIRNRLLQSYQEVMRMQV